ncbi:protein-disulfide reductase DsbD domain-containing protein [Paracoccus broussonetiae]|uniref:Protein-disulfide reductase DsbD domain-containing protein n=1 Tax=Paracoccus broussonetiae subsp. drimophilus TaxID=3373869 RepID=A0ABW7LNN5_9RHOB
MKSVALILLSSLPAVAQEGLAQSTPAWDGATAATPPGLVSAELMPGWTTPEGHRMTALRIELEPGWKTYWRSPGDAGVPPQFDWTGSQNLGEVEMHWPRPETIESGGERTFGYHDSLVLPIEIAPQDPARPVELRAVVDFGICDQICVPAQVSLTAPAPADDQDPVIEAALAEVPGLATDRAQCRIEEIADGMRVTALFAGHDAPEVAMELPGDPVWVSQPELASEDGVLSAQADFVSESGKPFAIDPARLLLTLIGPDEATEFLGCDRVGS